MPITCDSQISEVTVHARGAVVRRRVTAPHALPAGEVDLLIPGITLLSEPGSLRASLPGDTARAVVSVRSSLHVPESAAPTPDGLVRLRTLEGRIERLQAEHSRLVARRKALQDAGLDPVLRPSQWERLDRRFGESLEVARGLSELTGALDERIVDLAERLQDLIRERGALQLQISQSSTAGRPGLPTRRVTVRLTGDGDLGGELWLSYVVLPARFWPLYTLRISDGGKRAEMIAEALLSQRSGEDWTGVRLSLSTADLLYDARLPELPSLRFGRAQPPPKKAYRPPPEGLDRMFAGYDAAFGGPAPAPTSAQYDAKGPSDLADLLEDEATGVYTDLSPLPADGYGEGGAGPGGAPAEELRRRAAPRPTTGMFQVDRAPSKSTTGAPPPAPGAPPMIQAQARAEPMKKAKSAGLRERAKEDVDSRAMPAMSMPATAMTRGEAERSLGGFGGGGGVEADESFESVAPPVPEALEPADAWLDFDALTLSGPGDGHRGRLMQAGDAAGAAARRKAAQQIELLSPGHLLRDPRSSRGMFDHRYDAAGLVQVPSDGQSHRVALLVAAGPTTVHLRTVPQQSPEVYREVELKNPFDAPLLAGPVDVYLEGSLLCVTAIDHIDRGGALKVGMGVEDRVRVARNVRVEEETTGVLSGSTSVTHAVTIDLTSSLSGSVVVEVLDRLPVTDDKQLEIRRLPSRPEGEPYKQLDRGQPVRGGWLWRVALPGGGKASVDFQYRLILSAKSEIIGGNRRD